MLETVAKHTPLVPAAAQVQHGFELSCQELTGPLAGVRLFTVPGGNPDPSRSLVCLPGLGASGRSFAPMAPLAQWLHLLMWTPPLTTPAGTTPLRHNLNLLGHREAPLAETFSLLGSSYGSLIALAFAVAHQRRVRALVLVSPVASPRGIRLGAAGGWAAMRVPLPFAYVMAPLMARLLGGAELPPEARAEIVREARRIHTDEIARRLRDILGIDLIGEVRRLKLPVLVVHGGRDRIVPLAAARDLVGRLPEARLHVIPEAAHLPYLSHPEVFNAVVRRFLLDVGG